MYSGFYYKIILKKKNSVNEYFPYHLRSLLDGKESYVLNKATVEYRA